MDNALAMNYRIHTVSDCIMTQANVISKEVQELLMWELKTGMKAFLQQCVFKIILRHFAFNLYGY